MALVKARGRGHFQNGMVNATVHETEDDSVRMNTGSVSDSEYGIDPEAIASCVNKCSSLCEIRLPLLHPQLR